MKIVLNIILGLVALLVLAGGAVFLVAPSEKSAKSTVTVERPAASVFAQLASAPANQPIGPGMTQTVTRFDHPSRVEAEVAFGSGKKAKAVYEIVAGDVTTVNSTITENFGMNPFARLQGMSGTQLEPIAVAAGDTVGKESQRLKTVDFTGISYEIIPNVAPKTYLYLEAATSKRADQIKEGMRQSMNILRTAFQNNNLVADGQPVAVETSWEGEAYSFRFGIPYRGSPPGLLIGVKSGQTPSGPAIKVVYYGSEEQVLAEVYDKVDALLAATRLKEAGPNWEVYNDDPTQDGGSRSREIYYIIDGDTTHLPKIAPSAPALPTPATVAPQLAPPAVPESTSVVPVPVPAQ